MFDAIVIVAMFNAIGVRITVLNTIYLAIVDTMFIATLYAAIFYAALNTVVILV